VTGELGCILITDHANTAAVTTLAVVSVPVWILAAVNVGYSFPTSTQDEPLYDFNLSLVESYHRSHSDAQDGADDATLPGILAARALFKSV
jgi:hypothetical protein